KEAEATNSLIDQGVDVITMHVDSPKVIIEICEQRRIFSSGYHANQAVLAPKGYLTGAEWNWPKVYVDFVTWILEGKEIPHLFRGGLQQGVVKNSPYGPAVAPETIQLAEAAREKFMAGELVIYKGELKDNQGNVVIPSGEALGQTDIKLESMDYLVDGVIGSTGS
ncbi:MAG: BMP family ABC transporter substrate-binding protein, partial [Methylocella sp.]